MVTHLVADRHDRRFLNAYRSELVGFHPGEGTVIRFKLLSASDMKAMDSLKESHGRAQRIAETIEVRRANALKIGDVIYYKTLRCTKHAIGYMKRGIPVKFGQSSRR